MVTLVAEASHGSPGLYIPEIRWDYDAYRLYRRRDTQPDAPDVETFVTRGKRLLAIDFDEFRAREREALRGVTTTVLRGPLYKYLSPKFAVALVSRGSVRVGTLDYYRRFEDALRGDTDEGTATFTETTGRARPASDLSSFARSMVAVGPDADDVLFARCAFTREVRHRNAYVYCTAHEYSRRAAWTATACVEIAQPRAFFDALGAGLATKLGAPTWRGHAGAVAYRAREQSHEYYDVLHPAFLKAPYYNKEREVRMLWDAPSPPHGDEGAEPLDFEVPELARFCRVVDFPS